MPAPLNSGSRRWPGRAANRMDLSNGLAIDTSFVLYQGEPPKLLLSDDTGTDSRIVPKNDKVNGHQNMHRANLPPSSGNNVSRPGTTISCSTHATAGGRNHFTLKHPVVRSANTESGTALYSTHTPTHRRVKGLRPSPLDLSQEVSPSDRAIPIGIALSPSTASNVTASPVESLQPRATKAQPTERPIVMHKLPTPTILVTPAEEDFPDDARSLRIRRPTSSVYSRYTDGALNQQTSGAAPPVPPIPLRIKTRAARNGSMTRPKAPLIRKVSEGDKLVSKARADAVISICTTFEEDEAPSETPIDDHKLATPGWPTPRRSNGWWNVITSPFSAKSAAASFWRSPSVNTSSPDQEPMLRNASKMGSSRSFEHFAPTKEELESCGLRSAPVAGCQIEKLVQLHTLPKRSETAPGTLETVVDTVDIYEIPSQGLAASYDDTNKHFPSLYIAAAELSGTRRSVTDRSRAFEDFPEGWSPSHSVFAEPRSLPEGLAAEYYDENKRFSSPTRTTASQLSRANSMESVHTRAHYFNHSSDEDDDETAESIIPRDMMSTASERPTAARAVTTEPTPKVASANAAVFSTPSDDELNASNPIRTPIVRSATHGTAISHFSPFTATPVVENAHIATFVGPQSAFGEQREVDVAQQRGLPPATSALEHSSLSRVAPPVPPTPKPYGHARQDSKGLGIFDEKCETFPPVQPFLEERRVDNVPPSLSKESPRDLEGQQPKESWYKRLTMLFAVGMGLLLVLMIVLLVMFVPRSGAGMPVEAGWLNTTGFPAMPTGISTIIQPQDTEVQSSCVNPSDIWSCAARDDPQTTVPNFRVEIRFKNGTVPSNDTALTSAQLSTGDDRSASESKSIGKRDEDWEKAFTTWPSPPSQGDQVFIGQTTDNVSAPYNGEQTPFYMSLLDASKISTSSAAKLQKRDSNFSYPYPNAQPSDTTPSNSSGTSSAKLPSPDVLSNGKPADQLLFPLVSAQPLRLFNRGQDSEHYGFYTYFDRSLYLAGNLSSAPPRDTVGVVALENATSVCTWAATRFHVQIWTRRGFTTSLPVDNGTSASLPAGNSTADDMSAPGSFPYPVTVSLDRHGGQADAKGVYCYAIDGDGVVDKGSGQWIDEDRGSLINPARVPGSNGTVDRREASSRGIDGGTGGCSCRWSSGK